jgi:N-glycosylase/DNA lyase
MQSSGETGCVRVTAAAALIALQMTTRGRDVPLEFLEQKRRVVRSCVQRLQQFLDEAWQQQVRSQSVRLSQQLKHAVACRVLQSDCLHQIAGGSS